MNDNTLEKNFEWLSSKEKFVVIDDDIDLGVGVHPLERNVDHYIRYGVINLDKPRGPTSHQVSTWVKKILNVNKAGHGGTLDPGVSGVLPIGIERATPAMRYIVGSVKEYVGVIRLHGDVKVSELERVLELFRKGRVYQKPPLRSSVRRKLRTREIYNFQVIEIEGRDILFKLKCESGFYVRKLAHDIGLILGVGAHLDELRRVSAGPFNEDVYLVTLYDVYAVKYYMDKGDYSLLKKVILPIEYVFRNFPKLVIKDSAVASIAYGAQLKRPGIYAYSGHFRKGDIVALFTKRCELVAVTKMLYSLDEILRMEKGVISETLRVFIDRDAYPKMWTKSQ